MTDKRKTFRDAAAEIDIRLGDLLGELGTALQEAANRVHEAGEGEVRRESTWQTGSGPVRASAGIRIRTLGAGDGGATPKTDRDPGRPVNRDTPKQPEAAEPPARPISATILDEPSHWTLVADLPGITADDVALSQGEEGLVVDAVGRARRFRGSFPLPDDIAVDALTVSMRNGILELTAARGEVTP